MGIKRRVMDSIRHTNCSDVIKRLTGNLNKVFRTDEIDKPQTQQDHQALLKAKYCPPVAGASRHRKTPKNPCGFDL